MKLINKLNQFETYYLDDDRITLTSYEVKGCRKAETDELRIFKAFESDLNLFYVNTDVFKKCITWLRMSDYCVKLDLHDKKNYITLLTQNDNLINKLQIPLIDLYYDDKTEDYGLTTITNYSYKDYAYSLIHIKEYMKQNKSDEMCIALSKTGLMLLICDTSFMILAPRIDIE